MTKPEAEMAKTSMRSPRPVSKLPDSLHHRLGGYALAAGAAGVGVLACSVPADAAPVCGNLSVKLLYVDTYAFNPAAQTVPPFNIAQTFENISSLSNTFWNRGFFTPNSAGANVVLGPNRLPANLASGASIGPNGQFGKGQSYGLLFTYGPNNGGKQNHHRGNFNFNTLDFVGFKFSLAGKTHYGWVRMQVTLGIGGGNTLATFTHLQGYGYESTPDTAILAGSCTASTAQNGSPASLGALALGSEGLPLWRRRSPNQ
jgi:hypothetical protein